jgi:predicted component of type VI protein secretion system
MDTHVADFIMYTTSGLTLIVVGDVARSLRHIQRALERHDSRLTRLETVCELRHPRRAADTLGDV